MRDFFSNMNIFKSLAAIVILLAAVCDPASAQVNNNFANRTVLGSAGGTVSGSNVGATKETGEPNHAGRIGGKSVWWTWTPAVSGTAVISTEGSSFDTVLAVYTGTSVSALTTEASDDNSGTGPTSLVTFSVTAGTAYQIAVDGSAGSSGNISLTISPPIVATTYTLELSPSPGAGGTVSGAGTYAEGSSRTVRATASSGYTFTNWTENGAVVSSLANYTFSLNANRTLVASFAANPTGATTYEIKNLDVVRGELMFTEISGAQSYRVEWSKTLTPGSWSSTAPGISRIEPMGSGDRTVKIGMIQPPCFYRVVAELAVPVPQGFVLIPEGSFQMGDTFGDGNSDERPVHTVDVSAFFLQARETTKAEWDAVRAWALANGYTFDNTGDGQGANHPVVEISWYDIVKWCNARSEKEGLVPCYYTNAARTEVYKRGQVDVTNDQVLWTANGYRLPTEAEWEKAARGGLSARRFPWGDTITHSLANYYSSSDYAYDISPTRGFHPQHNSGSVPYTSPVGSFAPNGYGLYDMTGNVWERCWDWYDSSHYTSGATTDPQGPSAGSDRVLRGGSWFNFALGGRVALRGWNGPLGRNYDFGFRPALGQ
jgi:sulfatase modifying factor 1